METNYAEIDEHPCCDCMFHSYENGKNHCSKGRNCEDHDEDNHCGYRESSIS